MGSTGIPRKNWRPLWGHSPAHRALWCAGDAGCDPVILTTDDPTVVAVGRPYYVLHAPAPLHTDTCSMRDVVTDVLARVPGPDDQMILLVQPTQPLRQPKHLHAAIARLEARTDPHGCVISVVRTETVDKLLVLDAEGALQPLGRAVERRQDGRATYQRDGTVYAWRRASALYAHPWIPLEIPANETCPLDTQLDWENAERMLEFRDAMSAKKSR